MASTVNNRQLVADQAAAIAGDSQWPVWEVFTQSVVSLWVIPSGAITASSPGDNGPFFDPGSDKAYRHPQFYKVPRGVRGV